jgi:hypothetical protein
MAALLVHANHHEIYKKYCNDLGRGSNFGVSLELSWQPKGDLARQSQRPPMQIQSALNMHINIYIYTYHLCNSCMPRKYLYVNIYMKYQLIQWISYLSRHFWAKNFGTRIPRPPIKTNGATESKQSKIELYKDEQKKSTPHLPRTLIFHMTKDVDKTKYFFC